MSSFLARVLRFFSFYCTFGALIFIIAVNLAHMPPTAALIKRYLVMPFNPIARAIYLEELSSSAHRALLVRSALRLQLFQKIGRQGGACVPLPDLADHARKVMLDQRKKNAKQKSIRKNRPLSIDAMRDLLEALAALGLLQPCLAKQEVELSAAAAPPPTSADDEGSTIMADPGYHLTTLSEKHLYIKSSSSSSFADADADDEDDFGGMILAANTPEVITSLLAWADPAPPIFGNENTAAGYDIDDEMDREKAAGASLAISRAAEGNLWTEFAASTHGPFSKIARAVAQRLQDLFSPKEHAHISVETCRSLFIDVGCGSAVFSEKHCRATGAAGSSSSSSWDYLLVDLPEVVNHLKQQQNRPPSSICPNSDVTFLAVNVTEGPAFQAALRGAIREQLEKKTAGAHKHKNLCRVVFAMNSFLQHFSDEAVMDIIGRAVQTTIKLLDKKEVTAPFQVAVSVTELESPHNSYSPWKELLTAGRIFAPVLRSFAPSGAVRYEGAYADLIKTVFEMVFSDVNTKKGRGQWRCMSRPSVKKIWPLPGSNTAQICDMN